MNENIFKIKEIGTAPSIRYRSVQNMRKYFNLLKSKAIKVSENVGNTFNINAIIITSAEVCVDINDFESPKVSSPVVHLFTENNEHIVSMSKVFCNHISMLIDGDCIPNEKNPISIKITEVECSNGDGFGFELVEDMKEDE